MRHEIKKQPKNVFEIILVFTWNEVKKTYDLMLDEIVKNAEIKGFRKGKAPKSEVEKNLNKNSFFDEVQNKLITEYYGKIVKEENLKPIIYPRLEIIKRQENEDWEYKLTICEIPAVELGNYKEEIGKLSAKDKIWIPGKNDVKADKEEDKNKKMQTHLEKIVEIVKIDISDLLINEEMTKLLSELLEEIKKLGLTLDQYLASTQKTIDSLKNEYKEKAINTLKIEFILSKIAEEEKITVSDKDIQDAINEVKEDKLRDQLKNSSYQLAAIIRRQKTLDFITNL